MKVSILYITMGRYPQCIERLKLNLHNTGIASDDWEILWADNGSRNDRVRSDMRATPGLSYARENADNEGISRTLNQLILRARGDAIVQLGNDYEMPSGWLAELLAFSSRVPKTGMAGIRWSDTHLCPLVEIEGTQIHLATFERPIFGVKLKTRAMLDDVGAFDEMLHPYGHEDTDYHRRATLAGFRNYYIPNMQSRHLENDVGSGSEYRQMKNCALTSGLLHLKEKNYRRFGYYEPWPAKR